MSLWLMEPCLLWTSSASSPSSPDPTIHSPPPPPQLPPLHPWGLLALPSPGTSCSCCPEVTSLLRAANFLTFSGSCLRVTFSSGWPFLHHLVPHLALALCDLIPLDLVLLSPFPWCLYTVAYDLSLSLRNGAPKRQENDFVYCSIVGPRTKPVPQ